MMSLTDFPEKRIGNPAPNLTLHGWAAMITEDYIKYLKKELGKECSFSACTVESILRGDFHP